jgi:hypothetical protein
VVLANIESINAEFIRMAFSVREVKNDAIGIIQLQSLVGHAALKN